jgi:predicted ATPase
LKRIENETGAIFNPLSWLSDDLRSRFYYLESQRPKPRSIYHINPNPPQEISAQDDSAYQRLWYAKDETVQLVAPGHEPSEIPLTEALNHVLKSLGIEHSISIVPMGELAFQIKFQTIDGQESVSIPHVGVGISQILPVLLVCLESRKGDTLIIEHPEIHLHANAQALMADYFIELANSGRRVIVETHSQYFIRRLVRRTAEREDLADKINILFVRPPRGKKGATIAPLEMNEKGDISNWPPDFFPEPDEDTGKTLAARFERGEQ